MLLPLSHWNYIHPCGLIVKQDHFLKAQGRVGDGEDLLLDDEYQSSLNWYQKLCTLHGKMGEAL